MDTRCFKLVEDNDTEDVKVPPVVAGLQHFNSKATPGSVNTTFLHLLHVGTAPIRTALEQAPGTTFASSSTELGGTHWSNIEHGADLLNVAILRSPKLLRDFVAGSGLLQGHIFGAFLPLRSPMRDVGRNATVGTECACRRRLEPRLCARSDRH